MGIERHSPAPMQAICDTTIGGTSTEIPMAGFAGGIIIMPAVTSAATLTFYVGGGTTGRTKQDQAAYAPNYTQLYDDTNTAISRTVAQARAYRIPLEAFAAGSLKIVSNVQVTVEVLLKG